MKKLLSILLISAMVVTMLPAAAFAENENTQIGGVTATNTNKASHLSTDGIDRLDYIYYGEWEGKPIKWIAFIDAPNTWEAPGFCLTSVSLLGSRKLTAEDNGPWQGSGLQQWCKDFAGISGNSVPDAFTPAELDAILSTTITDYSDLTYDKVVKALNGDKVFELSKYEATDYIKNDGVKLEDGVYTLRSRQIKNGKTRIGKFGPDGAFLSDYKEGDEVNIRPAFNIRKSDIVFASPAVSSKTEATVDSNLTAVGDWDGKEWKLTVKDSSRNFVAFADKNKVTAGDTITISYSGAKTGDNEYVTAIITDENNEILYYGRIAQNSVKDRVKITVPRGLESGEYVLKIFSEQDNGDYYTDYVSEFVNVNLTVGIRGNLMLSVYSEESGYDYIYYGSRNGTPIKWRVLDNETNTGEPGYFLLSEELMGSYGEVYFAEDNTYSWQNSHAKSWCKTFAEDSFTEDEKKHMIAVSKTEDWERNDGILGYQGSVLENEKVFFLSIFEARNPEYGLDSNERRAGKLNDRPWKWWLRSRYFMTEMGYIDENGQYTKTTSFAWQIPAARPAFNLDGTDILFLSKADGGKADTETDPDLAAIPERGNGEWKLTIKDSSRNFTAHTLYTSTYEKEAGETVTIRYSGAKTGSNEYVSAIFADKKGKDLYYGRIAADSSSGIADVAVPETLPAGEYTLKIYSEQYNGEYRTDYASDFVEIPITVTGPDATDPQAKIVSARRISLTEAEVVFQSNEPGTYSYTFVNSGEVYWAPANPRGEGIIPRRSTEQTAVIRGLTPRVGGELHLYVEDRSRNQYQGQLRINIPADVMYDVTLNAGKDTVIAEGKNVTQYVLGVGEALPAAEDMSKSGSVFKGWYAESDFSGTPVTEISDTDAGDKVFYAKWEWDLQEQFDLAPGTTCYFDLSGEGIPGKINGGNSDGAVPVPDKTLHYVPFTYAGTIDAYRLSSDISTTDESALANRYVHSLFVSDYNLTNTVSWRELKNAGLVFGKSYNSGNIGYTLRIPSGGNRDLSLVGKEAIRPYSNEWDTILDKNEEYIKNVDMFSWMQEEEYSEGGWLVGSRVQRGHRDSQGTIRSSTGFTGVNGSEYDGYRPVLEIQNTNSQGADALKIVTLDLNGGSIGDDAGDIKIVVKNGEAFTAPASEGITNNSGYLCEWLGSDGKTYSPGESVPAEVTSLTAQWKTLTGEIKAGAHTWNRLMTDADFNVFFKNNQRVEITASGENSGNVDISYLISDRKLTEAELKTQSFTAYTGAFTPEYGDKYIIYAGLTDNFGKTGYISSEGIVIDNTAPVISGITEGEIYCEAGTVSIDETYIDSVTVNGSPVTLAGGKFTLNPAEGRQVIVATDKAGNTARISVTVNDGHTLSTDIGDCTEEFLCRYCNTPAAIAAQHDFGGSPQSDEEGHWYRCQNRGCSVCDTKEAHRWKDAVCEECGYRYVSKVSSFTTDDIKTTTDSRTAEKTTSATVKNVITETAENEQGESISKVTAAVSQTLAEKLVSRAVSDKASAVEITVKSDSGNKVNGEKSTELEIPESVVESIVKNTNASLVIKTDLGQVALDNRTLETIASEAEGDTVKITVNQNTQLKKAQKTVLDIIGDRGYIFDIAAAAGTKNIHDFGGGMAHVTIPVPEKLKDRDIAVIHISDKGICEILNHTVETVGADKYIKFITAGFSTFAVVEKADADKLIQQQNLDKVNALIKEIKLKTTTTRTTKKNVRVKVAEADKANSLIKEIEAMGYTVKYRFCRSEKASGSYVGRKTKTSASWINTSGTKGTKYYYRAKVYVYDGDELIAKTLLKQCSCGVRIWSR